MLILFKPWRSIADLRQSDTQAWAEALEIFLGICDPFSKERMRNMQVLHECKDSRDDHFARRSKENWQNGIKRGMNNERGRGLANPDDFVGKPDESSAILDHLESIERGVDGRMQHSRLIDAEDCITQAEESGMYSNGSSFDVTMTEVGDVQLINEVGDDALEEEWREAYKTRCADQRQMQPSRPTSTSQDSDTAPSSILPQATLAAGVAAGTRSAQTANPSIKALIDQFTLNREQSRAFEIIASRAIEPSPSRPLRMFLGGAGGTGKSRVLDALKEFFIQRGERGRLRLTSFTGVAARNISGTTLHSALNLVQRKSKASSDKSKRNLIAMWEGVDFLFVDEVSMIGCKRLEE